MISLPTEIAEVLEGKRRWCVVCADNREILPLIPAGSVASVTTDPNYSEHVHGKQKRLLSAAGRKAGSADGKGHRVTSFDLGFDSLKPAHRLACAEHFARVARRWVLCFSDLESTHLWQRDLEQFGLQHIRVGVWNKLCGQPQLTGDRPAVGAEGIEIAHQPGRKRWNGRGLPARWDHPIATDRNGTGERFHTTQKPLSLMLELVEQFTDPDEIVLDAFSGSGTTGAACVRLGRRFIGLELNAAYAEASRARLAAESQGISYSAAKAGQIALFGGGR